jgi:ATP-binding cassette subfamily B protein
VGGRLLTLNGIPYSRISRISLRDYISYLSQKPFLFPGTIRDNIRIGNPNATEEQST